ncbi:MAG TPA: RDD family protein [Acidimicrobiales bacterium]
MSDIPQPPPPEPVHGTYEKVGPWPRFGARIIDGLILLIPNLVITGIFGGGGLFSSGFGLGVLIGGLVATAFTMAYSTWFESDRGQTPGKMLLGLRVIGSAGGNPTVEEAFRRNAFLLPSVVPVLGSVVVFVMEVVIGVQISSDPHGRGLHDNFAGGTMVTRSA